MNDAGSDLRERLKDEQAFVHPWMGNDQLRFAADEIAVEEQIEIEGARSILGGPHAAELAFDFKQEMKQVGGSEIGLQLGGGVEIRALIRRSADRRRLVECGNQRHGEAVSSARPGRAAR